jgi:hypothetical protein
MDRGDRAAIGWWAALVALTLLSFEGGLQWLGQAGAAAALVIVIALVKMRIVVMRFMEAGHAPWVLRGPLEVWLVCLGAAMLVMWYL